MDDYDAMIENENITFQHYLDYAKRVNRRRNNARYHRRHGLIAAVSGYPPAYYQDGNRLKYINKKPFYGYLKRTSSQTFRRKTKIDLHDYEDSPKFSRCTYKKFFDL